ncbi:MAG TPA: hypothetical protein VG757_12735 [Devosia sp.]|nr:hypothetical protein [Devosia sp.]
MAKSPINSPGAASEFGDTERVDQESLRADANAALDEAKQAARNVADEATEQAGQFADQAKEQLAEATEKVKSMAGDQKELLAQQFGGVADAIEKVAVELEDNEAPAANYARMVADNATMLSEKLQNADVDELLGVAQDFGRKQPVAFMGAAALLGFAASRFLLASAKRQEARMASEPESMTDDAAMPRPNGGQSPDTYETGRL